MADLSSIPPASPGGPSAGVGHVGRNGVAKLNGAAAPAAPVVVEVPTNRMMHASTGGDRVELSDIAQYLDRLRSLPEVRMDRVNQMREAIATGQYDTPEKFDAALDRMFEEMEE